MNIKAPLVLGLESSCDETAVALVCGDKTILAQRIASQMDTHRPWGGVVPEISARAHVEILTPLVRQVLADANLTLANVDAIAATAGPGLIGGLMVGLVTGKALALAAHKPLIAVNHLEGHALSPRLVGDLSFPYLLLLVSGGHCQLLRVEGIGQYKRLATTIDDAAGEAFDKVAKMTGLGYPGGPLVEAAARTGDPKRFAFPRPLKGSKEPHFSFAGLKSAVVRQIDSLSRHSRALREPQGGNPVPQLDTQTQSDICASFQAAVIDCLTDRTRRALDQCHDYTALVVAGGVAANTAIRTALESLAAAHGLPFIAPPQWLCTDNAAMIAWAGVERFNLGLFDDLHALARARWPLDPTAEAARGAGVKA
jgi:N6-L-threonylcarbamoyladenine synthase